MLVAYISCLTAPVSKKEPEYITSEKTIVVSCVEQSVTTADQQNSTAFYSHLQIEKCSPEITFQSPHSLVLIARDFYFELSDKIPEFRFSRPPPALA